MSRVENADILTLIGAILSTILGSIYLLSGIYISIISIAYRGSAGILFLFPWAIGVITVGILSLIFGFLTLFIAREKLLNGDLKTGAILCFIFGGISAPAIGGILTIVAGILAIIGWYEERKAEEITQIPPPPPSLPPVAAHVYCIYCGAKLLPEAAFCSSCGRIVKK